MEKEVSSTLNSSSRTLERLDFLETLHWTWPTYTSTPMTGCFYSPRHEKEPWFFKGLILQRIVSWRLIQLPWLSDWMSDMRKLVSWSLSKYMRDHQQPLFERRHLCDLTQPSGPWMSRFLIPQIRYSLARYSLVRHSEVRHSEARYRQGRHSEVKHSEARYPQVRHFASGISATVRAAPKRKVPLRAALSLVSLNWKVFLIDSSGSSADSKCSWTSKGTSGIWTICHCTQGWSQAAWMQWSYLYTRICNQETSHGWRCDPRWSSCPDWLQGPIISPWNWDGFCHHQINLWIRV